MDYKKGNAGKKAKKDVAKGANAAMGSIAEQKNWDDVTENLVELRMEESVSKAVITLLNVLAGNATPAEHVFGRQIMDAPGALISFDPMTAKPKKKGILAKLLGKKPKVMQLTGKYARPKVEEKLLLYFKLPQFKEAMKRDSDLLAKVLYGAKKYPELKAVFDDIYNHVNSVPLLIIMIRRRFGVEIMQSMDYFGDFVKNRSVNYQQFVTTMYRKIIEPKYEPIDWNAEALKCVYKSFMSIPQGHLDLIDCLIHSEDVKGQSVTSRNFLGTGVNDINYDPKNVHYEFKNEGLKNGADMVTFNVAHELGHVVDFRYGRLSKTKEMRDVSQWEEIPNVSEEILTFLEGSIDGAFYDGKLNDEELKIAHDCAIDYLNRTEMGGPGTWEGIRGSVQHFVEKKVEALQNIPEDQKENVVDRIVEVLMDDSLASNVLNHCWWGRADHMACYNYDSHIRGMKRPFYQGYNGQSWYSFNKNCWSNKISRYQYRDPSEEFAELYASYHAAPSCGKKKGEMTPQPLLQWFLKKGLDKAADPKTLGDPMKEIKKEFIGGKKKTSKKGAGAPPKNNP